MASLKDFFKNMPEVELDDTKKKTLLAYAFLLLAVIVAYFNIFLKPSITTIHKLVPEVHTLKADIKSVEDNLRFEETLKTRLEKSRVKMTEYEEEVSREKELPMLLENLSEMARESNVKILGIKPLTGEVESSATKGVYQEIPILITAKSGYHELGKFINKLENGPRFMAVRDISIKGNRASSKKHDIQFTVYAYTFKGSE